MGDCCMQQRREWGTMAAVVGNLRHDLSTDVVELLWVLSYIGIRRVTYQTIGDASPTRWERASPLALELSARQPPCRMGRCAVSANLVHHGGMMRCGSGVKEGGIGAGGDYSHRMQTRALMNDGGSHRPTVATRPHSRLLSIQQSTNKICNRTMSLTALPLVAHIRASL